MGALVGAVLLGMTSLAGVAAWLRFWVVFDRVGLRVRSMTTVTVGQASAKADATAQIFGADGKLDVQLGASAKAEAIAAEVEGFPDCSGCLKVSLKQED